MPTDTFPTSPTEPRFVAAVVGILSVFAVAVYLETAGAGPSAETFTAVLLAVLLPVAAAYELASRVGG